MLYERIRNLIRYIKLLQYMPIKINMFDFSIGYPVVTLGFGFKSYVGYRMRQVGSN